VAAVVSTIAVVGGSAVVLGPSAGSALVVGRVASSTAEELNGVSCTSASACFAVGESFAKHVPDKTLVERWNGKVWSIVPSANPTGGGVLKAVSCTSATFCMAVGVHGASKTSYSSAVVERWNGKTWSIVASPSAVHRELSSVSCTSATFCFAVGDAVERWDGTKWSTVTGVRVGPTSVSCASSTACFGVNGLADAARWNGKTWLAVPAPQSQPGSPGFGLNGVSCPSSTTCFAVGSDGVGADSFDTLVERWNGKRLSHVPSPGGDYFNAVSCASPTSCAAVGIFDTPGDFGPRQNPMDEQWNGTTWSEVTGPAPAGTYGPLNGVSCTSPTSCFAVGYTQLLLGPNDNFGPPHTFIQQWNGTNWSIVASP
jgi:hypothetical protein